MKISVVTISFNQAKFLRQCIDSVLGQNYKNFEYIIVDPGSTDGSRELIASYGERIIKVFEKDSGPADGLNVGFSRASGDIFYFINADDYVLDNAFSFAARQFAVDPNLKVLLGAGIEVDATNTRVKNYYPSKVSAKKYVNGAVTLFQQGMFFSANAFKQVKGFNSLNRTSWDGELLLNFLLLKLTFNRSMVHLGAFRIYPESITGSQRFAAESNLDKIRLYKLVYGHDSQPNRFIGMWLRFTKIVFDPTYTFYRLFRAR